MLSGLQLNQIREPITRDASHTQKIKMAVITKTSGFCYMCQYTKMMGHKNGDKTLTKITDITSFSLPAVTTTHYFSLDNYFHCWTVLLLDFFSFNIEICFDFLEVQGIFLCHESPYCDFHQYDALQLFEWCHHIHTQLFFSQGKTITFCHLEMIQWCLCIHY